MTKVDGSSEQVAVTEDGVDGGTECGSHQCSVDDVTLRHLDQSIESAARPCRDLLGDEQPFQQPVVRVGCSTVDGRCVIDRLVFDDDRRVRRDGLEVAGELVLLAIGSVEVSVPCEEL